MSCYLLKHPMEVTNPISCGYLLFSLVIWPTATCAWECLYSKGRLFSCILGTWTVVARHCNNFYILFKVSPKIDHKKSVVNVLSYTWAIPPSDAVEWIKDQQYDHLAEMEGNDLIRLSSIRNWFQITAQLVYDNPGNGQCCQVGCFVHRVLYVPSKISKPFLNHNEWLTGACKHTNYTKCITVTSNIITDV